MSKAKESYCLKENNLNTWGNYKSLTLIYSGHKTYVNKKPQPEDFYKIASRLEISAVDFYTEDIVMFYVEYTEGKTKEIINSYENTLKIIGKAFNSFNVFSRKEVSPQFWNEIITYHFPKYNFEQVYINIDEFLFILYIFVKWLDNKYGWEISKVVRNLIEDNRSTFKNINL